MKLLVFLWKYIIRSLSSTILTTSRLRPVFKIGSWDREDQSRAKEWLRGIEKEVVKKYSNRKKVKQTMHELLQIGLDATSRPSPEAKPDLNRAVLFLRWYFLKWGSFRFSNQTRVLEIYEIIWGSLGYFVLCWFALGLSSLLNIAPRSCSGKISGLVVL